MLKGWRSGDSQSLVTHQAVSTCIDCTPQALVEPRNASVKASCSSSTQLLYLSVCCACLLLSCKQVQHLRCSQSALPCTDHAIAGRTCCTTQNKTSNSPADTCHRSRQNSPSKCKQIGK
jgi:hypothetical protein